MDGGCIQENCPQGVVNQLRTSVTAAHELAENGTTNPETVAAIESKLEEIEEWLVDDSTSGAGAVEAIEQFVTDLAPYQ